MPSLHKVLKKMLHRTCLTGFRIFLRLWIWQGSKYVRVTQSSEQCTLQVLNMSLVLKWQGYRELWVLCKLCSRDSRYSEYVSGSQCTKILNVSGILIYLIFTGYIDWVFNISRVLNIPEFWICKNHIPLKKVHPLKVDVFNIWGS